MSKTKVALLGTGFIANIHMESYTRFVPDAQVVAVYSRDGKKAAAFAKEHGIPQSFDNIDTLLKEADCEVVDICRPTTSTTRPAWPPPGPKSMSSSKSRCACPWKRRMR